MTTNSWTVVGRATPVSPVLIGTVPPTMVGEQAERRRRHSDVVHALRTQPGRRGVL
ncbi:hypothetical protein [Rhodococcus sp. IEGM 1330]|uniref:hypothetical protein n=1 Tax=Rhodococcus sp. IEGM 1330 TaxID=3082225 RepID=UPI002955A334|nr:hypothetical protein [Rhodococcus sp. IEGM 1330]MDV8023564.1 hypothetical protein [Rhodococcus sp. IEGM 1330]